MWAVVILHKANSLFGAVKWIKKAEIYKRKYSWYGIGFDMNGTFSVTTGRFGKSIVIFGVHMSSSEHVDNKKKYISILGKGL